jgi:hypothetical protein
MARKKRLAFNSEMFHPQIEMWSDRQRVRPPTVRIYLPHLETVRPSAVKPQTSKTNPNPGMLATED